MPVSINGNTGVVTGLAVGGLPDGTVDADTLASNAVTAGKLASGVGGKILQVVSTTKTDIASNSTATQSYWNNTDFKVTITPSSASSKLFITACIMVGVDSQQSLIVQLRKDGSILTGANADAGVSGQGQGSYHHSYSTSAEAPMPAIINYLDTAGNTTQRYYSCAYSHTSGSTRTMYLNRGSQNSGSYYMAISTSTITVMEVAA